MKPEVCVGAVVVDDDALLLVRRGRGAAPGRWSIPGGRVDYGETLAEAVLRELQEETGLEGVCGRCLGWVERISADAHFVIFDFDVVVLDSTIARAGDDASEVAWVALDELIGRRDLVDGLLEFLRDVGVVDALT